MAEKDANQFLDQSVPADGWGKFRETLIGLTDVTRNHFDKLVQVSNALLRFSSHAQLSCDMMSYRFVSCVLACRRLLLLYARQHAPDKSQL